EGAFPLVPLAGDEAAAATDAGVVEQQVDVVGLVLVDDLVTEAVDLGFVGHITEVGRDASAGRGLLLGAERRLRHVVHVHVARRDRAALGGQLDHELATHAGSATGDDSEATFERFHELPLHGSGLGAEPMRNAGRTARVRSAAGPTRSRRWRGWPSARRV